MKIEKYLDKELFRVGYLTSDNLPIKIEHTIEIEKCSDNILTMIDKINQFIYDLFISNASVVQVDHLPSNFITNCILSPELECLKGINIDTNIKYRLNKNQIISFNDDFLYDISVDYIDDEDTCTSNIFISLSDYPITILEIKDEIRF